MMMFMARSVIILGLMLAAIASGAMGSNAMLIGEVNRRVAASHAGLAIGVVVALAVAVGSARGG